MTMMKDDEEKNDEDDDEEDPMSTPTPTNPNAKMWCNYQLGKKGCQHCITALGADASNQHYKKCTTSSNH